MKNVYQKPEVEIVEIEVIDKIMAEHGKVITSLRDKNDSYRDELDNYKKEVESYKAKVEKLNKTLEDDKVSLENLKNVANENDDLKAQIQMSGANVKKEFMKFVTSEVRQKVNDETDFETALKDYKKENPQYFGDVVVKKVQSSPELTGGNTQPQTTNNIMNDILRGGRNND